MARDVRQLRAEAAEASAAGKHKRALACYLELEQLEPRDAQWSKRAAETYKRLEKNKDAISAFTRAADRYATGGFLVQAIAVCKLILQMDPKNDEALRRISSMNEQIGAGPTRAVAMAESNPGLHASAAVAALRTSGTGAHSALQDEPRDKKPDSTPPPIAIPRTRTPQAIAPLNRPAPQGISGSHTPGQSAPGLRMTPPAGVQRISAHELAASPATFPDADERNRPGSTPPPFAMSRTKSKPIALAPDQPLDMISLKDQVPDSFERKERSGVYVIPIDDPPVEDLVQVEAEGSGPGGSSDDYGLDQDADVYGRASAPVIEVDDGSAYDDGSSPRIEVDDGSDDGDIEVASDQVDELDMEDIEEIPLAEPRMLGSAAADALARTPLFAGLSREALESLVQQLTLVHLGTGEVLFHEGDPGDALYVIVEGEVAVQAEGPPRVEMARLGPGAFIGEVALMTDQPRSATISAVSDAELLRIDRQTLSGVLAEHGEILPAVLRFVRDRLVDRWTRTSPLFRPFDDSVREQIASRFRFLEVDSGATLLQAGQRPDGLYIVLAGKFTVKRAGAHLATVGPGELIGETALLAGAAFKSEVVAHGKSLALCLPAADFRELIMTHPHVLEYIGEAAEQSRKLEIL